jgi:hypothetical protein
VSSVATTASPNGTCVWPVTRRTMPGSECCSVCRCLSHGVKWRSSRWREHESASVSCRRRRSLCCRCTHVVAVIRHPHLWADQHDLATVDDDAAVVVIILVRQGPTCATREPRSARESSTSASGEE